VNRRQFTTLLGGMAAPWPLAARAQPTPHQTSKIGWLKIQGPKHTPSQLRAFREGIQALRLIEGHDYVLEEVTPTATRTQCNRRLHDDGGVEPKAIGIAQGGRAISAARGRIAARRFVIGKLLNRRLINSNLSYSL
jgi:hypothetical protein